MTFTSSLCFPEASNTIMILMAHISIRNQINILLIFYRAHQISRSPNINVWARLIKLHSTSITDFITLYRLIHLSHMSIYDINRHHMQYQHSLHLLSFQNKWRYLDEPFLNLMVFILQTSQLTGWTQIFILWHKVRLPNINQVTSVWHHFIQHFFICLTLS